MSRNLVTQILNSQHRHILITITLLAALIALFASFSAAAESSPWLLRIGAHNVAPKSNNHDIDLVGGGKVAETKHLPPTLSAQYHFNSTGVRL